MPVDFIIWILLVLALFPVFWLIAQPSTRTVKRALIVEGVVIVAFFLLYILPIKRLERAAHDGDPAAQYRLAHWYRTRYDGMLPNDEKGIPWLLAAARQNFTPAIVELARRYEFGQGVERDIEKAKELYAAASRLGDNDAKELLETINDRHKDRL